MNGRKSKPGDIPERSAGGRWSGSGGFLLGQLRSCKRLAPVLAELEETYGDALKVVKVNINFDLPLAEKCEVTAAPTLIFFKNGAEQDRRRGLVKKAELTEIVENLK